jgi:hypothetical protein
MPTEEDFIYMKEVKEKRERERRKKERKRERGSVCRSMTY